MPTDLQEEDAEGGNGHGEGEEEETEGSESDTDNDIEIDDDTKAQTKEAGTQLIQTTSAPVSTPDKEEKKSKKSLALVNLNVPLTDSIDVAVMDHRRDQFCEWMKLQPTKVKVRQEINYECECGTCPTPSLQHRLFNLQAHTESSDERSHSFSILYAKALEICYGPRVFFHEAIPPSEHILSNLPRHKVVPTW